MKRIKKLLSLFLCVIMIGCVFNVNNVQAASKIKLNKTKVSIYIGKSLTLKVTGTKNKITWKSDDKKIATVTKNGKVTGKKKGTTTIYAYVKDKSSTVLKCKVTVKPIISVSSQTVVLSEGQDVNVKVGFWGKKNIYCGTDDLEVVSCKFSKKWVGDYTTLIITGEKAGQANVYVLNDDNKEKCIIHVIVKENQISDNSFTKLKKYILAYGDTNTNGNKFIYKNMEDNDGNLWTWAIIVENDVQMEFMISRKVSDEEMIYGKMILDSNSNTYAEYELLGCDENGVIHVTSSVNPATYTKNTKLKYNVLQNDIYEDSSLPNLVDNLLEAGLIGWNFMLEDTGISLKDLGFSLYRDEEN